MNGKTISVSCLADTGADGYLFVNVNLARTLIRQWGLRTRKLPHKCPVTGFDGESRQPITHAVRLTFVINGRVQQSQPILIADIGRHDVIIGRLWFERHGVLVDCRSRRLYWPNQVLLKEEVLNQLTRLVPRQILKRPQIELKQQQDADRRDALIEKEIQEEFKKTQRKPTHDRTPRKVYGNSHTEDTVKKMQRALLGEEKTIPPLQQRSQKNRKEPLPIKPIEIAAIRGVGFHRHLQREGTKVFVTSLAEIDRIIDEKQRRTIETEEIHQAVPAYYHDKTALFSKIESDMLPPLRGAPDHRIELEEGKDPSVLGYCPLYKQTEEELRFAKDYILKNLSKGFIVPSTAPFQSPILMAEKPGGGLRFCVDYRKLNALTKKDRYPIPLIDEMLQRVSKARYYTKLDIYQGFHRIRMDPGSEDLTTFRSRYGSFKYKVLPFGLTNGPATFQRYINHALGEYLDDFCTAFIDDVLIYTDGDLEQH